ncbi:hypothetical protein BU25DRAFT_411920 [Macroventuria anomochaeta]|uniref:Uncharacterized protein n=1 Tax=Macroventuria anomochaeta TaxID=301207 RepID=A0ACB6RWK8_9PLEO|nr:uncharacterized protein BU25DRAFT_411920 [Macroventuria anomochaeta]KAF2626087.1 hypothetical protein BU25DRAFT_411920 [Macroventuria anomochaeta]
MPRLPGPHTVWGGPQNPQKLKRTATPAATYCGTVIHLFVASTCISFGFYVFDVLSSLTISLLIIHRSHFKASFSESPALRSPAELNSLSLFPCLILSVYVS